MRISAVMKKFVKSKMFTLLIFLALLVLVVTLASGGNFIRIANISQILDQMFVTAMLTIGAAMLLISGQLDLSTGAVGTMAGMMCAFLLKNAQWPLVPTLIITLALSAVIGILNAVLINEFRFPGFIATLATASIAEGITYMFTGGITINMTNEVIKTVGSGKIGGVLPISVVVLIAAFFIYGMILSRSKFGRYVYLIGGNLTASHLAGVNTKKISYILFVNSSILGALAGIILSGRVSSAVSTGIMAQQFAGITAAILGGVAFGGGAGGMGGAFMGLLILTAFSNGMVVLRFDPYWRQVVSGLILLFALMLDFISSRRLHKSSR